MVERIPFKSDLDFSRYQFKKVYLPGPFTNLWGESALAEPSDEGSLSDARVTYEDHLKNPLRVGCEAVSALGLAQRENELWKILAFHLFCCTYYWPRLC